LVDNVNTHAIGHAGQTLALMEGGCTPAELSYDLDTLRYTDFEGTLPGGFSAHPKKDPHAGDLHAITYRPASRHVKYVVVGTDALVRRWRRSTSRRRRSCTTWRSRRTKWSCSTLPRA
jgi:carotenoid cleavage dioxygenase